MKNKCYSKKIKVKIVKFLSRNGTNLTIPVDKEDRRIKRRFEMIKVKRKPVLLQKQKHNKTRAHKVYLLRLCQSWEPRHFKVKSHFFVVVKIKLRITLAQESNLLALFLKNSTFTTTFALKAHLLASLLPKLNSFKGNCRKTIISISKYKKVKVRGPLKIKM